MNYRTFKGQKNIQNILSGTIWVQSENTYYGNCIGRYIYLFLQKQYRKKTQNDKIKRAFSDNRHAKQSQCIYLFKQTKRGKKEERKSKANK